MLLATIVSAVAAVAAAIIAGVQARAASQTLADARDARDEARLARDESSRLAAEANEARIRQARAQEEANELTKRGMPDWMLQEAPNGVFRLVNTSGRPVLVGDMIVHPPEARENVTAHSRDAAKELQPGDAVTFVLALRVMVRVDKVVMHYRFVGDPEDQHLSYWITMPL